MVGNLDGGVTLMWGSLDCAQALWNAAVVSTKPWFLLSISEINIFSLRSLLMNWVSPWLDWLIHKSSNACVILKDFLIYSASTQFELKLGDMDGGQTWWWVTLMMGNLDVGSPLMVRKLFGMQPLCQRNQRFCFQFQKSTFFRLGLCWWIEFLSNWTGSSTNPETLVWSLMTS